MRCRTYLLLALLPVLIGTKVYRWTDERGQAHFSDQPREGATQVEVGEPVVVPPPAVSSPERPPQPEQQPEAYRRFQIVVPASEATIRDNQGQVPVSIVIEPALRAGHAIEIRLDGKPYGTDPRTRSTRFTLNNVDRGEHRLTVVVVDREGREQARSESTFFLHRAIVRKPNR